MASTAPTSTAPRWSKWRIVCGGSIRFSRRRRTRSRAFSRAVSIGIPVCFAITSASASTIAAITRFCSGLRARPDVAIRRSSASPPAASGQAGRRACRARRRDVHRPARRRVLRQAVASSGAPSNTSRSGEPTEASTSERTSRLPAFETTCQPRPASQSRSRRTFSARAESRRR